MKRALIITAAAVVVAAAALLVWRPWSETTYMSEDVPASCADLAGLREELTPGAPGGEENVFDGAGKGRVTGDAAGTTLNCAWITETLAVRLAVEHWTDGADAAEASFVETRAEFAEKGTTVDAGDEAVVAVLAGTSVTAVVRTGNVVFQIRSTAGEQGSMTVERATEMLRAAVAFLQN